MRNINVQERRARLAQRHFLADAAPDVEGATAGLIGLHSSDPATVYLSSWARVAGFEVADLEESLYVKRSLIRILGMRRTMFVVPTSLGPIIHGSSTRALAPAQRKRTADMVEKAGIASDGARWIEALDNQALAALKEMGEATAAELTEVVPQLGEQITAYKADGSVMGKFGMSTRILFLLAVEGLIVRGRPRGSWLSSQYEWSTIEHWAGEPLTTMDRESAQVALLSKWLARFGPATELDMKWWTGWPITHVRRSLEGLGAVEVSLDGQPGYVHPDDTSSIAEAHASCALLPGLDPTVMGWKDRDWYLGPHRPALFDSNGNAGPTIWLNGRVVGGWAQRPSGEIVYELLEHIGTDGRGLVEIKVAALQSWLGDVVVTPRFRTPLERRLADS